VGAFYGQTEIMMSLLVADWTRYVWRNHTCNCVQTRNNTYPTDKWSCVFIYLRIQTWAPTIQ